MKEIVSIGDDPERRKRGGEFSFGIEGGETMEGSSIDNA